MATKSYDKPLDIYYLSIAYISTLRNWTHHFAFQIGRFLCYYHLINVTLFARSGRGLLLFFFPSAGEAPLNNSRQRRRDTCPISRNLP